MAVFSRRSLSHGSVQKGTPEWGTTCNKRTSIALPRRRSALREVSGALENGFDHIRFVRRVGTPVFGMSRGFPLYAQIALSCFGVFSQDVSERDAPAPLASPTSTRWTTISLLLLSGRLNHACPSRCPSRSKPFELSVSDAVSHWCRSTPTSTSTTSLAGRSGIEVEPMCSISAPGSREISLTRATSKRAAHPRGSGETSSMLSDSISLTVRLRRLLRYAGAAARILGQRQIAFIVRLRRWSYRNRSQADCRVIPRDSPMLAQLSLLSRATPTHRLRWASTCSRACATCGSRSRSSRSFSAAQGVSGSARWASRDDSLNRARAPLAQSRQIAAVGAPTSSPVSSRDRRQNEHMKG